MLLNYLFKNFLEEADFAHQAKITTNDLNDKINRRTFPLPSYVLKGKFLSVSFVSNFEDNATYHFHIKGHLEWIRLLDQLDLSTEEKAKNYFFQRYNQAKSAFLLGEFGQSLASMCPNISDRFDHDHISSTWDHFLNGVYGVCTKNGTPENIFLKQAAVMFIDEIIKTDIGSLTNDQIELLDQIVTFLDNVESEFAPHEVTQSSRQRCIINVREKLLFTRSEKLINK